MPVEPGTEAGWLVIEAAVRSARDRLGDGLRSAYAIGSLAHGGFSPSVSDVDLALLTDDRVAVGRDVRESAALVAADVRASGLELAERLSIFICPWSAFCDPPPDARFPPIDRHDLVHYGILVAGTDLRDEYGVAPTAAAIREQAVGYALGRVSREQLAADLRALEAGGVTVHDATKIVLWPVRLQHVCDTGQANGNAAAVGHYLGLPDARHRSLVREALSWREVSVLGDPQAALRRLTDEIVDLHAEVFLRLGDRADMPRRDELAALGQELSDGGRTSR